MSKSKLILTLGILKPSIVAQPHIVKSIIGIVQSEGLYIVRQKKYHVDKQNALHFYKEHEGKFFYNRLVTYMSSGPSIVLALAGTDAIQRWRKLLGPTKVYKTQFEAPASIRGLYGISDTRNAAHGSDSQQSAESELKFFFPEFDTSLWYNDEEPCFRHHQRVRFDDSKGVHCCVK